jgi:predicted ATPase
VTTETTKENWCEAEVHRMAGEIALVSRQRDVAKGEAYFERALTVARARHAKSWELRAAISMARLRCDQGKREEARDLLARRPNFARQCVNAHRADGGQSAKADTMPIPSSSGIIVRGPQACYNKIN